MTVSFWLIAGLMGLLAAAFVLLPLYLARRSVDAEDRTRVNVEIFTERLAELESQRTDEVITEEEFVDLRAELEKNLLSETTSTYEVRGGVRESGKLPFALALLIPLFAIFAYAEFGLNWGALADLEIATSLRNAAPGADAAGQPHAVGGFDSSVARLATRLQSQPDNDEGWFLLAQSYMNLELYERAAGAFKHLLDRYPTDPDLVTYYAEALFLADGRLITARVDAAINQTLALDPGNITMLEIRGMDAFARGEMATARRSFARALESKPEPARAGLLEQAIARIDGMNGTGGAPTVAPGASEAVGDAVPGEQNNSTAALRTIDVLVEVDDVVDVGLNTPVFVFARAVSGPPMPLAVARLTRKDLPTLVKLDESMAMMAGMGLANFDRVQVVARISTSGIANVSPDDFEARSNEIDLTVPVEVVKLKVTNRVRDL